MEQSTLNRASDSNKFEFIIIYGRKRVGKTELILKTAQRLKRVYYLAVGRADLEFFVNEATKIVPEGSKLKLDWEMSLDFLKDKADVVVIDEFQTLIEQDPLVLNLFQRVIDNSLAKPKIKIIVCGSSVSLIKSALLNFKMPLYGRRTMSMELLPVNFFDTSDFFRVNDLEQLITFKR